MLTNIKIKQQLLLLFILFPWSLWGGVSSSINYIQTKSSFSNGGGLSESSGYTNQSVIGEFQGSSNSVSYTNIAGFLTPMALTSTEEEIEEESNNDIVVPVTEDEAQWETTVIIDDGIETTIDETEESTSAIITLSERTLHISVASGGAMEGTIESKDTDGNPITSTIKVAATQSETTVDAEGTMETVIETEDNATVTITVSKDGTVKHQVQTAEGKTVALSTIAGADVEVDTQGNITTTSEVEKEGYIYRAVVTTDTAGETTTKFVKIDVATHEETNLSYTLKAGDQFGLGDAVNVFEQDGIVYIEIVSLDEILEIE